MISQRIRTAGDNFYKVIDKNIKWISTAKLEEILKNRKVLFSTLAFLLILTLILSLSLTTASSNIPTYKVKKGNFLVSITEGGELRAKKSIPINAPRIRSELKIIYLIPEGTYVKPGDVLIRFDPTEASENLKQAKAQLEIAVSERKKMIANHSSALTNKQLQLKSSEISFELSKLKLEQIKYEAEAKQQEQKLQHEQNKISYDQTKKEYENLVEIQKSEIAKMEIEIRQKENDLERAKRDLDNLELKAASPGLSRLRPLSQASMSKAS